MYYCVVVVQNPGPSFVSEFLNESDAGRERRREGPARSATQRSKEDVCCKRAVELGDATVHRTAAGRAASPRSPCSATAVHTASIAAFFFFYKNSITGFDR
jgi:hypothetical protein